MHATKCIAIIIYTTNTGAKEESYFKSFSFEGNKKGNVFLGSSYGTENHPFSEHEDGGDYDVLDINCKLSLHANYFDKIDNS